MDDATSAIYSAFLVAEEGTASTLRGLSEVIARRGLFWREALCIEEERRVGNDNTVVWHRLRLQIPPSLIRSHDVRAMVRVHEYPDGRLAIYHGPHRLADYTAAGGLVEQAKLAA